MARRQKPTGFSEAEAGQNRAAVIFTIVIVLLMLGVLIAAGVMS